jgi:hypothetical protein
MLKDSVTSPIAGVRRERGAIMILFLIGLVAIIGMAGLALDGGHTLLNKTRLQNTVDAAALSAAKILDDTGDVLLAEADARATFADNAGSAGNGEIGQAYADGTLTVTVQFSSTLYPFVAGSSPAEYVRVRADNFAMRTWFSNIVGVSETRAAASAVAGPSPTINHACNIMPMMVCGDPGAGAPYWGYTPNEPEVLKSSTTQGDFEVGPGNFQLIRLGDNTGGADIREAMAGSFDACAGPGEVIETEPGNTVGPVVQGLNTRFGNHLGPMSGQQSTYPADAVTDQPVPPLGYDQATDAITYQGQPVTDTSGFYSYEDYVDDLGDVSLPLPEGVSFNRREVAVPIGDCSVATNGQGQVPLLGFGCFFLLQEAQQKGNESFIYGEFVEDCLSGGMPGPAPTDIPGPYIIQLYRDFQSIDS